MQLKRTMTFVLFALITALARDVGADMAVCKAQPTEERQKACEALIRKVDGKQDCANVVWSKMERKDPMTDELSCTVNTVTSGQFGIDGSPFVLVTKRAITFSVVGEIYPGTDELIRVDERKPHRWRDSSTPAQGMAILREVRSGTTIKTQYNEWPSGADQNFAIAVCNLPAVVDECSKSVGRHP